MPFWKDRITVSLGIPELEVVRMEENEQEVRVWVRRRLEVGCCPGCGRTTDRIHSHWESEARDLPMSGKQTVLLVTKRRFRCVNGCQPFLEEFGCLERYKRQTKRYRGHLENACRHSSLIEASRKEDVGYKQLDRLYYDRAEAKVWNMEGQELPRVLGVDEFSGKRRVRMHMSLTDLSAKPRLWDVMETKGANEFIGFFSRWSREVRDQVQVVVHDMDQGIRSWTRTMFRRAFHVVDKFHLVRTLLKHQERVRKVAYRNSASPVHQQQIRSAYFLIRRRYDKMSDKEKQQLQELFLISRPLQEACEFKEAFMRWYDTPQRRYEAERELDHLHDRLRGIPHLKRFSWVLDHWREEILNYFMLPYTNGFTEGMNNKIKTLKRQAYGFRNFNRFRARILTECAWN